MGKSIALCCAILSHLLLLSLPGLSGNEVENRTPEVRSISLKLSHPLRKKKVPAHNKKISIQKKKAPVSKKVLKRPVTKKTTTKKSHPKKKVQPRNLNPPVKIPIQNKGKLLKAAKPLRRQTPQTPIHTEPSIDSELSRKTAHTPEANPVPKQQKPTKEIPFTAKIPTETTALEVIKKGTVKKIPAIPSKNIRIERMIHPVYPMAARREKREGTVQLKVEVLADGGLGTIELFRSSGSNDLDVAALDAVKKWQFKPALRNGAPIRQLAVLPVHFTLK